MNRVRLGAVSYLNTKPLVFGLDQQPDRFSLRFDVPAVCAARLHQGDVDLGLVPVIEYARGRYRIVPGVAIGANGPIASVALFSKVPAAKIETIALDTSSRTSVALTKVLCARHWRITPRFVTADPDLRTMLAAADAALVIGDPALFIDAAAEGVRKYDLGEEWQALTGLPFVFAVWAGRDGAVAGEHVRAIQRARDEGLAAVDRIADCEGGGDPVRAERIRVYLRDNLKYGLGDAEQAGLSRFLELATALGLIPGSTPLRFYE